MSRNVMKLTYTLAMAISRDAGNRSMRKAGRKRWSVEDWNAACAALERVAPHAHDVPEPIAHRGAS